MDSSLITVPVLNNVNIPVNIRATLGNLIRQPEDDASKMDSNLVAHSLSQHGTPLLRWLEAEQREHLPQAVVDRAYRNEFVSRRALEIGDAPFNIRLNQFIARKGDLLFKRQAEVQRAVHSVPAEDTYAIMPPLESFMGVPAHLCRQHFYKSVEKGDVLVGVVTTVMESGLIIQLLCMDNERVRDIDALKIMAFCPSNEITPLHKHFNPTENFQIQDVVRGVVILVNTESEKVVLSLHNSRMAGLGDISLGLITEDQFPVHYRRRLAVKGLTFEELMASILGFKNPGNRKYLTPFHGLQDTESFMRSLHGLEIPEQEYAENVRKLQSARKAHQSVLQGVTLFKQGNYLEAMQHLNRALQIDEKNVEGLVARGALYANKESYSRAIEDFDEALKQDPHHVNAYTYLVETLLALAKQHEDKKEWTDSEAAYYRVLTIYPDHPEATANLRIVQQKKMTGGGPSGRFDAIADSFMDLIQERKPGEKPTNRRSWSYSSDDNRSPDRRRSSYGRKGSRSPDSRYQRRRSRDRSSSLDRSRGRIRSPEGRKDKRKDSKRRNSKSPEKIKEKRKSKGSPNRSAEKSKKGEKEEKSSKKSKRDKSRSPSPHTSPFQKPRTDPETPQKKTKAVSPESSSPDWGERKESLHITRVRSNSFDEDEYLYGDSEIGYEKETFKAFPGFHENSSSKLRNDDVLLEKNASPDSKKEKSPPQRKVTKEKKVERETLKLKSFDDEDSRSPRDHKTKHKDIDEEGSTDRSRREREGSRDSLQYKKKSKDKSRSNRDKSSEPEPKEKKEKRYERSESPESPKDQPKSDKKKSGKSKSSKKRSRRSETPDEESRDRDRSISKERGNKQKESKKKHTEQYNSSSEEERTPKKRLNRSASKDHDEKKSTPEHKEKKKRNRWDKSPEGGHKKDLIFGDAASSEEHKSENRGGWREVEVKAGSSILKPEPKDEPDILPSRTITRTVYRTPIIAEVKPTQVVEPLKKSKPSFFLPRQIIVSKKTDPKQQLNPERSSTSRDERHSLDRDRSQSRSRSRSRDSHDFRTHSRERDTEHQRDRSGSRDSRRSSKGRKHGEQRDRSRSQDGRRFSREVRVREKTSRKDRSSSRSSEERQHRKERSKSRNRESRQQHSPSHASRSKRRSRSRSSGQSDDSDHKKVKSKERRSSQKKRSRSPVVRGNKNIPIHKQERFNRRRSRSLDRIGDRRRLGPRYALTLEDDKSSNDEDDRPRSDRRRRSSSSERGGKKGKGSPSRSRSRERISRSRSKERRKIHRSITPDQKGTKHLRRKSDAKADVQSPERKRRSRSDSRTRQRSPEKSRSSRRDRSRSQESNSRRRRGRSQDSNTRRRSRSASTSASRKRARSPERRKSLGKRRDSRSSSGEDKSRIRRSRSRTPDGRTAKKVESSPKTKPTKRRFQETKDAEPEKTKKEKKGDSSDGKTKVLKESFSARKGRKFVEKISPAKSKQRKHRSSSSSSSSQSPSPHRNKSNQSTTITTPVVVKSKWDSSPKSSRWDPPVVQQPTQPKQPQAKQFLFNPIGNPTSKNTLSQLETFLLELKQKKKQGEEETPGKKLAK